MNGSLLDVFVQMPGRQEDSVAQWTGKLLVRRHVSVFPPVQMEKNQCVNTGGLACAIDQTRESGRLDTLLMTLQGIHSLVRRIALFADVGLLF